MIYFNGYKRYKAGTVKIISWLVESVKSCGRDVSEFTLSSDTFSSSSSSSSLKESKGKKKTVGDLLVDGLQPTANKEYEISCRVLTILAEIVVDSTNPRIVVPYSILGLLDEVISLRRQCSAWLSSVTNKNEDDRVQDESHRRFIAVLEDVRMILRQQEDSSLPMETTERKTKGKSRERKRENTFDLLPLEEPADDTHAPSSPEPAQSRKSPSKATYEEIESQVDMLVASWFFFRDLKATRDFLKDVWSDYRQGRTGLIAASLVTNTALEQIQQNTEDHWEVIAKLPGAPEEGNYIWWFYCLICSDDPTWRERPSDGINMKTYDEAEQVCLPAKLWIDFWSNNTIRHDLNLYAGRALSFNRSNMSGREKYAEDGVFIIQMAEQFHNFALLNLEFPPAVDEVTRSFRRVVKGGGPLPPWLAFSLQILIDIYTVLGKDMCRGFETLQSDGSRVASILQLYFRTSSKEIRGRNSSWHKFNDKQILKLIGFISRGINQDVISKALRSQMEKHPDLVVLEIYPFFFLKTHPLFCGLLVYWLNTSVRRFGIALANVYGSILSAVHLYNAARQSALLSMQWPDIDYIISVNTPERLFIGGLPTTPADYLKRFQIALGSSAVNYARNRRTSRYETSSNSSADRMLRVDYPVHDIFNKRCFEFARYSNLSAEAIDALLTFETAKSPARAHHIRIVCQQWAKDRKLSSLQLLEILRYALEDDEMHIRYDYISLHVRCALFLLQVRSDFIAMEVSRAQARATATAMEVKAGPTQDCSDLQSYRDFQDDDQYMIFLKEDLPDNDAIFFHLTTAIFVSDPITVADVMKFTWCNNTARQHQSRSSPYCQVPLEHVAKVMADLVEHQGSKEVEEAAKLCPPNAGERGKDSPEYLTFLTNSSLESAKMELKE